MKDLIIQHGEKLYTTSLIIAEQFGRRHDNVLATIDKLIKSQDFNALKFKEVEYKDSKGESRRMYELDERTALKVMPFIGGRNSRIGQDRLVDGFMEARAEIERLRSMRQSTDWQKIRYDTKEAFKLVALVLDETRKLQGKDTKPYHYMNEAKMMNAVLTGEYKGIDRDLLTEIQLNLLDKIQAENSRLLIQGKSYQERKQILLNMFVPKLN